METAGSDDNVPLGSKKGRKREGEKVKKGGGMEREGMGGRGRLRHGFWGMDAPALSD